jgi:hypothetical protein
MPTDLNAGYTNNVNVIQSRVDGAHSVRYTDRPIDYNGDGAKSKVTITFVSGDATGTPAAPGGKMRQTVTKPTGIARSIVDEVTETDGGVHSDSDVDQFTEGS